MKLEVNLQTGEIEMHLLASEKRVLTNALNQTRQMSRIKAVDAIQKLASEASVSLAALLDFLPKDGADATKKDEGKEASPPLPQPAATAPKPSTAGKVDRREQEPPKEEPQAEEDDDDIEGAMDLSDDEGPSESDEVGDAAEPEDDDEWETLGEDGDTNAFQEDEGEGEPDDDSEDEGDDDEDEGEPEPPPAPKPSSEKLARQKGETLADYRKRLFKK